MGTMAFGQQFLDPQTAFKLQSEDKAILIDVRESDETKSGMAKGALWLPLSKVQGGGKEQEKLLSQLSKDKLMVVYCRSGKRAETFIKLLRERGYKAENMGGFSEWEKANLPITKS
jgi:rhodanese-related sulfurtransferase